MNNTTKLIIAGAVGVAAFFGYKAIKKKLDEKKDEEQAEKDRLAREAEGEKKEDKSKTETKTQTSTSSGKSKPAVGEPTAYEKRVMVLQELLNIKIDGDAGKQTNGTLDYWWSPDVSFQFNSDKSFKDGYVNLTKNGKGKVSASNVEYYIKAMQDRVSPRHNASGRKSVQTTNPTEELSRKLIAKLNSVPRGRLTLKQSYTAKELIQTEGATFVATANKRTWSQGTSFFRSDFYAVRAGTGNLMYKRGESYYEIPPTLFEFRNY